MLHDLGNVLHRLFVLFDCLGRMFRCAQGGTMLGSRTALEELAEDNRQDEHNSNHYYAGFAANSGKLKAVLEQLDGNDAQNRARNGAASSENTGSAEYHRRNHVKLNAGCGVSARGGYAGGEDKTREPGHEPAEGVNSELGAPDVQPGEASSGFIVAYGVERSSERGSRQGDSRDDCRHGEQVELDG